MRLEAIRKNTYAEPDRMAVQDAAIKKVLETAPQVLRAYATDPRSFGGRYVAADLFKEQFEAFAASPEGRNRYNGPVHNAAAVLASAQFTATLNRTDPAERKEVILLTGSPGAGKTTTVLERGQLHPEIKLLYEGQLSNIDTTKAKLDQVIAANLRPTIVIVHPLPENALHNTLHRYAVEGRGASINVMSAIQGGMADSMAAVRAQYGDRVALVVHDVRDRDKPLQLKGWNHLDVLRSEGTVVQIKERLSNELEQLSRQGRISEAAYRQAAGLSPERANERDDARSDEPGRDRLVALGRGSHERADQSRSEDVTGRGRTADGNLAAQEGVARAVGVEGVGEAARQGASREEMVLALKRDGYLVRDVADVAKSFQGQTLLIGKDDTAVKLGTNVAVLVKTASFGDGAPQVGQVVQVQRGAVEQGKDRER